MKSIAQLNAEIKVAKTGENALREVFNARNAAYKSAWDAFLLKDPEIKFECKLADPQWSSKWNTHYNANVIPHRNRMEAATKTESLERQIALRNYEQAKRERSALQSELRVAKGLERLGKGVPLGDLVMCVVNVGDRFIEVRSEVAKGRYVLAEMDGDNPVRAIGPTGTRSGRMLPIIELPL